MNNRISIVTLLCLVILNGCSGGIKEEMIPTLTPNLLPNSTNTIQLTEAITSVPTVTSTETLPQGETFTLTVSMRDIANITHIYDIVISCFETTPCVLSSKELFDFPTPASDLNWSSDGKSLAFSGIENENYDIFVATNGGKIINNITKTKELEERSPNWSPDGTRIAYSVQSSMEPSKILVSNPGGTSIEQILTDVFEPFQFTWSHDGRMAYSAFVSTHDGRYQIRVLNKDGSLYLKTPIDDNKMGFGTTYAAFSPDNKWLLYTGTWLNNSRVFLANLENKTFQEVVPTDKTCNQLSPSWSPDGQWLAFISNCESQESNQYQLYLMNLAQSQKIKLDTGIDGSIFDVTWRPNDK